MKIDIASLKKQYNTNMNHYDEINQNKVCKTVSYTRNMTKNEDNILVSKTSAFYSVFLQVVYIIILGIVTD